MTDPARWLAVEIPEWTALERKERRAIRDFPVLWALFELHATGQNGQHPNATPQRICDAVAGLAEAPALRGEPRQATAHFAGRYFVDGQPTEAWLHLRVEPRFCERVRHGLIAQGADDLEVITALLLVINRLRNNFLHGEKARNGFRDQYENFRHANNVLVKAIGLWPRPH